MRWLRVALVSALLSAVVRADETDWRRRLEEAVARAVARNPSIAEMESRIAAAQQRVGQATALPDAEIEIGIENLPPSSWSFSQDEMTMEKVLARQTFPAAGKRPARKRSAEAGVETVEAEHAAHVVRLSGEVADAFFAVADVDARIAIFETSRERAKGVAASASERYRVGKGALADVLRANLVSTALEERLTGLRGERRIAAARLNTLQGLAPGGDVAPLTIPPEEPSVPPAADLIREAQERSPAVASASAQVRVAGEELSLADLERRPDFTATAYYAHRVDFDDLVGAFVGLNLPFLQPGRIQARKAEKEAEVSGARASLAMVQNEIARGVGEAYADLERSLEQARLYRSSILPQAQTSAAAAQEAYTVGQIDFLTFVSAALDLDLYGSELASRQAGAWRAVAALQIASGLPMIPGTPGHGDFHAQR
jgi:cobalt-zinc-cadmium efflux system outer membrane protein